MGKLISHSEQELVHCDVNDEDQGCEGGLLQDSFQFIINSGGLTTEARYPYNGTDRTRKTATESSLVAKITGYEVMPARNEAKPLKPRQIIRCRCPLMSEGLISSSTPPLSSRETTRLI
ncbi:hypothetical protein BT93_H2135 [Corymbia citriodora subsp. variegata]|nr:hypothetical protein BT93_H2135 [Corymbia citriodora subsp. variegata]